MPSTPTPPLTVVASAQAQAAPFISRPDGQTFEVIRDGNTFALTSPQQVGQMLRWTLQTSHIGSTLSRASSAQAVSTPEVLAVLEGAFSRLPGIDSLTVQAPGLDATDLKRSGILLSDAAQGTLYATPDLLWQQPRLWQPEATSAPFPLRYTLTQGKRHPLRPPKPTGIAYQRFIPWLGKTFSYRALDIEQDLQRFNRWMNDPEVARFWEEAGDLDKHRRYLQAIADDPHMSSLIGCFDGEPFAYFEVYWARENRIGPFYDVGDHDRGWHVLVGEPAFRGKAFATAWLTSISHYLFLDDPRTQRVVGEPRSDHTQQIRNLDRSGFSKIKTFDFPHKRAMLVSMLRERYFNERLWLPAPDAPTATAHPHLERA